MNKLFFEKNQYIRSTSGKMDKKRTHKLLVSRMKYGILLQNFQTSRDNKNKHYDDSTHINLIYLEEIN